MIRSIFFHSYRRLPHPDGIRYLLPDIRLPDISGIRTIAGSFGEWTNNKFKRILAAKALIFSCSRQFTGKSDRNIVPSPFGEFHSHVQ